MGATPCSSLLHSTSNAGFMSATSSYGGFLKWGYPESSSSLDWDFLEINHQSWVLPPHFQESSPHRCLLGHRTVHLCSCLDPAPTSGGCCDGALRAATPLSRRSGSTAGRPWLRVAWTVGFHLSLLSRGMVINLCSKEIIMIYMLVGGLEHQFYFLIYWECHHPN